VTGSKLAAEGQLELVRVILFRIHCKPFLLGKGLSLIADGDKDSGDTMQKLCDLFLCEPAKTDRLRSISLFDKGFLHDPEKHYSGYLRANIDRIKMIPILSDLRKNGINCFNVPIAYRDGENLSIDHAFALAMDYARTKNAEVSRRVHSKCPPVYWAFDLLWPDQEKERVGGVVMIDRLDGHVWTASEYEEYMYDYNNVF
jgi:hypothetical protein